MVYLTMSSAVLMIAELVRMEERRLMMMLKTEKTYLLTKVRSNRRNCFEILLQARLTSMESWDLRMV